MTIASRLLKLERAIRSSHSCRLCKLPLDGKARKAAMSEAKLVVVYPDDQDPPPATVCEACGMGTRIRVIVSYIREPL